MSEALLTLLYLAVAVEFITETLRESFPPLQRLPACWISAVLGIFICYLTDRGLLAPASGGFIRCVYIDYLLTGLLISRGAGVMHDLISAFSGLGRRLLKGI
ncbi:MAG TPA: hypothetical protein PLW51_00860 [Bacillota bacterium]|nr:hypothetical protein [Bacillota bacterium]HQD51725.1 hypothetical protein [Bacillota bacterium]